MFPGARHCTNRADGSACMSIPYSAAPKILLIQGGAGVRPAHPLHCYLIGDFTIAIIYETKLRRLLPLAKVFATKIVAIISPYLPLYRFLYSSFSTAIGRHPHVGRGRRVILA